MADLEAAELLPPTNMDTRTKAIEKLVGQLSAELKTLSAKQKASANSILKICDHLEDSGPEGQGPLWIANVAEGMDKWLDTPGLGIGEHDVTSDSNGEADKALAAFKDSNLKAAKTRTQAYQELYKAYQRAVTDRSKLAANAKAKPQDLEAAKQKEAEALAKAQAGMEVANEQLRLLEEDWRATLLNAARHMLHGQLLHHAKGVEAFTAAMLELPRP